MELLSHITKRLQTRPQVQLPVNVLIEQLDGGTPLVQVCTSLVIIIIIIIIIIINLEFNISIFENRDT